MQNPSRLNKTEEIIKLAMMFQNSYCGLCIDDIQNHFECSRRSAERMKAVLFDIFSDKIEEVKSNDKKKRWRFKKGTMNFLVSFSSEDFANLEQLKGLLTDKSKQQELDELILKIKALTPQKNLTSLETDVEMLIETEGYAVKQYPKENIDSKIISTIRESILSFKKVKIAYVTDEKEFETVVYPYGILIADRRYLIAYNEYKKAIRQYRLGRIKSVELIDEYFDKDEKFDLKKYAEKSFGVWNEKPMSVELLFDSCVKDEVLNYHFHPTQKIKVNKDDTVTVKFKASGELAICWELFKWGDTVKIVAPESLKSYYVNLLNNCINKQ